MVGVLECWKNKKIEKPPLLYYSNTPEGFINGQH
jgi:hypothetical protein